MYGISAFAQSPFAALGGNYYPLSITEAVTSNNTDSEVDVFYEGIVEGISQADSSTQTSAFYYTNTEAITSGDAESITAQFAAIVTEALTSADAETIGSAYFFVQVEDFAPADAYTTSFGYPLSITEGISVAEIESFAAQFAQSITEALSILDANITGGWNTIDDTQNAQWGGLTVTITAWGIPGDMLFGGAPIAGQLINITTASAPVGATPVIVWQDIVDTNTPGWTFINDTQ